jgi:oligopeptide transport system permease protein
VLGFIIRRVVWLIPVLFVVSLITFTLMKAVPGGPWSSEKPVPAAVKAQLEKIYGLDKPPVEQYLHWITGVATLDFGPSYQSRDRTVNDILEDSWLNTVHLGLLAFLLAILTGIPLGIIAALGHNRLPDYLATAISMIGIATPSFVLAILLVIIFSVTLNLFPSRGWDDFDDFLRDPVEAARTWVLPVIALAGYQIAQIARYTRASMLEVTRKDYVRTAHSKGVRSTAVVVRHMIRNALIPVVTILGPILAFLVTGSFIIESFFGIPGIGRNYIQSISARDYSMIMAATMIYAFAVAFLNLVVDVLYAYIDPRIRYS